MFVLKGEKMAHTSFNVYTTVSPFIAAKSRLKQPFPLKKKKNNFRAVRILLLQVCWQKTVTKVCSGKKK